MSLRVGGLFAGVGGLEQGLAAVLDIAPAWFAELDPAASRVLAHRYPEVPNLGDITAVDWSAVEPVDILTGGFPCQDVSSAGRRRGLRPGTRTGLWSRFADAIDQLRPALVIAENVRGLLSADAHSDLESCPWCLGDEQAHVLRALGAVLGDLAELGYDARWHGLLAADVGAPHGRFRVFVTAWPARDPDRVLGSEVGTVPVGRAEPGRIRRLAPAADSLRDGVLEVGGRGGEPGRGRPPGGPRDGDRPAADPGGQRHGREQGHRLVGRVDPDPADRAARGLPVGRGPAPAADPDGDRERQARTTGPSIGPIGDPTVRPDRSDLGSAPADPDDDAASAAVRSAVGRAPAAGSGDVAPADPARSRPISGGRVAIGEAGSRDAGRSAPADPDGLGRGGIRRVDPERRDPHRPSDPETPWGPYKPAIHRWETILGRPAPSPVTTTSKGNPQLSGRFTEWLMGYPDGWVTEVPGIRNTDALRLCGNGVVPQQAAAALRILLPGLEDAA